MRYIVYKKIVYCYPIKNHLRCDLLREHDNLRWNDNIKKNYTVHILFKFILLYYFHLP